MTNIGSSIVHQQQYVEVCLGMLTFYSYWIHMDSVGITKPGGQSKTYELSSKDPKGQPVSIKAGSTYSYLPAKISDQIAADFPGAKYLPDINVYEVDCALASQDGTVDFGFGKTVIHVPYSEIIFTPPGDRCFLGVGESVGDYAGLGSEYPTKNNVCAGINMEL